MDDQKLIEQLKKTQAMLSAIELAVHHEPKTISVRSLLRFYYRHDTTKLNRDNPGGLVKIAKLMSDRSMHFLLFMFGVAYPISAMIGKIMRSFTQKISLGMVSKLIVFDVTSNIFIYILLLLIYTLVIMVLCRCYRRNNSGHVKLRKKISRYIRNVYNEVLQYVINMFTIYATLIGTIFTISSSINKLKIVLIIAFFFSLIIIPTLSISLFVSTVNHINDMRE